MAGFRARLRGAIAPPPQVITAEFLSKTRSGAGGLALEASPGATVSGGNAADFVVDARSAFAPAGTYGAVKTFAASSYDLGVVGVALPVAASIITGGAHVAAVNSGTNTDSSSSSQLKTIFQLGIGAAGALVLGDRIVGRPGHWNPSSGNWAIDVPTGTWAAGSGSRLTLTSQTPATGTDADGHPVRGGDFQIGAVVFGGPNGITYPVDVRNVTFYWNTASLTLTSAVSVPTTSTGLLFNQCRFFCGPLTAEVDEVFAISAKLPCAVTECHFENIGTAFLGSSTGALTFTNNVLKGMVSDGIQSSGAGHVVTDNFMYDWAPGPDDHPDSFQLKRPAAIVGRGTFRGNISVRNNGAAGAMDAQGFFDVDSNGFRESGLTVQNHIHFLTMANQILLELSDEPDIRFNTVLADPFANTVISAAILGVAAGLGGNGGVFTHNVANTISLASQSGSPTIGDNVPFALPSNPTAPQLAAYLAALTVAFPNFATHVPGSLVTRLAVLRLFTPADLDKASGGVKNSDGTFCGALFPAPVDSNTGIGARNDGSVFNPTDPTWLAAHPSAL